MEDECLKQIKLACQSLAGAGILILLGIGPVKAEHCYELLERMGKIGLNSGVMIKDDFPQKAFKRYTSVNREDFAECIPLATDPDQNVYRCGSRYFNLSSNCIWEKGVIPKDKSTPGCWGYDLKTRMVGFSTEWVPGKTEISCVQISETQFVEINDHQEEYEIGNFRIPLALMVRIERLVEIKAKPVF